MLYEPCREFEYGSHEPSACITKGSIALSLKSDLNRSSFWLVYGLRDTISTVSGTQHHLKFINRAHVPFPSFIFQRNSFSLSGWWAPHVSLPVKQSPICTQICLVPFAMLPQLCVPRNIPRPCFIFIKLNIWRYVAYFISKFMVFSIEFNHEFYYV